MIDEKIYEKLTPSAREAINELTEEFRENLMSKAFMIAQERETSNKEISLRDILEAKQPFGKLMEKEKDEYRKKRWTVLISFSGAIYAVAGILIYLFQNNKFSIENDLGLIIAIIGILFSLIGFLYGQLISKRYLFSKTVSRTPTFSDSSDYEIVKRWQVIETLAKQLMTEADQKESKNNSVGFLIRFLSHKVAKNEKEFLKIRELLQTRNKILHEQFKVNELQRNEFLTFANELIERLENSKDENYPKKNSLKVISARYGSNKNYFDMTKELNQLIQNNRLEFILNNEIVGDPIQGVLKQLEITYEINGVKQTMTYNEGAKVVIQ